jgi:hypothetical protein
MSLFYTMHLRPPNTQRGFSTRKPQGCRSVRDDLAIEDPGPHRPVREPEVGMAPQSMSAARLPVRVGQWDPVNIRPLLWILSSRRIFRQVAREERLTELRANLQSCAWVNRRSEPAAMYRDFSNERLVLESAELPDLFEWKRSPEPLSRLADFSGGL